MAAPGAGDLDRVVQFRRAQVIDDGFTKRTGDWADLGEPIRARRHDVTDVERYRAQEISTALTARFTVRWSAFTASITTEDQLVCEGITYEITGRPREVYGRHRFLEINAAARSQP